MKYRGVVYDVGLHFEGLTLSVETFDPALVEHDMRTIAHTLHANAVRIEGEPINRLVTASRVAHANGLAVFFNPWKMNADVDETREYYEEAACKAEELRKEGVDITFVAGCEYTIFNKGVFPGETFTKRVTWLGAQLTSGEYDMSKNLPPAMREKSPLLNEVLHSLAAAIRPVFNGPVTYSAGSWESVDWSVFDVVGIDHYRRGESTEEYLAGVEKHRSEGKPIAVMEVGCCTYIGAAARGDGGFVILTGTNPDGSGKFKDDIVPTRSETEQADYVEEQLGLLDQAELHGAFIFLFSFPSLTTGDGSWDLDLVSFALVMCYREENGRPKEIPPWVEKEGFWRVRDVFGRMAAKEEGA